MGSHTEELGFVRLLTVAASRFLGYIVEKMNRSFCGNHRNSFTLCDSGPIGKTLDAVTFSKNLPPLLSYVHYITRTMLGGAMPCIGCQVSFSCKSCVSC